jgi:hypothetical protein
MVKPSLVLAWRTVGDNKKGKRKMGGTTGERTQEINVLDYRVKMLEEGQLRLVDAVDGINRSMQVFARLEEKDDARKEAIERVFKLNEENKRAIAELHDELLKLGEKYQSKVECNAGRRESDGKITKVESKVVEIQKELPELKQVKKWIYSGLALIVATFLASVFDVVSIKHSNDTEMLKQQTQLIKRLLDEKKP